jgi:hypothetical protein
LIPGGAVAIEFHAVEPQLGVIEEVEHGEGDALVLRRLVDMEIPLASVEPRQRVPIAILLGKL